MYGKRERAHSVQLLYLSLGEHVHLHNSGSIYSDIFSSFWQAEQQTTWPLSAIVRRKILINDLTFVPFYGKVIMNGPSHMHTLGTHQQRTHTRRNYKAHISRTLKCERGRCRPAGRVRHVKKVAFHSDEYGCHGD